jgi:GNAT superfamily N-acetyltransferase
MTRPTVRAYRPEDRTAVRRVCFETGSMGDPIAWQYADEHSFADMLTAYYTDAEPDGAWVAELDGRVVGYMLSCLDSRKAWNPGLLALRHGLRRHLWLRPGTASFYWRGALDLARGALCGASRPWFDLERYPSHTHNNLVPEGRGAGVAKELFFRAFDRAKLAGSPGMHGVVWSENRAMLRFAQALGYRPEGEPRPSPGLRYPDGRRVCGQLMLRDLNAWEPGAWQERARHE